jgi:hypothetical protein
LWPSRFGRFVEFHAVQPSKVIAIVVIDGVIVYKVAASVKDYAILVQLDSLGMMRAMS